ncbi:hypothetical protein DRN02_007585 [Sphingomonas paucimobilis]|uniref:hypothetical protein n=1 Tax=Sphingomonas paucimobilis TaxID=13689 RepID=UPI000DE240EF|nr:hypothetical protein [Sphingomonas paucimobilis]QBE91889.1 hypothetical protein DRN02_007585 [Sphingomonas paucimobilis]
MTSTDQQFPPYPEIVDLPAGLTEHERYAFAFRLLEEQGENIGDYLFAAVRQATTPDLMVRWAEMAELAQQIYGEPITLTYRACDRMAAERLDRAAPIETKH